MIRCGFHKVIRIGKLNAVFLKKATVGNYSHFHKEKQMAKKKESKFMQALQISDELAAVIGKGPMPRTEVTKKLWEYIKKHKCQDTKNRRNINPDEKLAKVFGGKKSINMFEMTKIVSKHLKS